MHASITSIFTGGSRSLKRRASRRTYERRCTQHCHLFRATLTLAGVFQLKKREGASSIARRCAGATDFLLHPYPLPDALEVLGQAVLPGVFLVLDHHLDPRPGVCLLVHLVDIAAAALREEGVAQLDLDLVHLKLASRQRVPVPGGGLNRQEEELRLQARLRLLHRHLEEPRPPAELRRRAARQRVGVVPVIELQHATSRRELTVAVLVYTSRWWYPCGGRTLYRSLWTTCLADQHAKCRQDVMGAHAATQIRCEQAFTL